MLCVEVYVGGKGGGRGAGGGGEGSGKRAFSQEVRAIDEIEIRRFVGESMSGISVVKGSGSPTLQWRGEA